jgi:hypothetical protein
VNAACSPHAESWRVEFLWMESVLNLMDQSLLWPAHDKCPGYQCAKQIIILFNILPNIKKIVLED